MHVSSNAVGVPSGTPLGFEEPEFPKKETRIYDSGGSRSGSSQVDGSAMPPPVAPADPELTAVVAAWTRLPAAVRQGIAIMVRAAAAERNSPEAPR